MGLLALIVMVTVAACGKDTADSTVTYSVQPVNGDVGRASISYVGESGELVRVRDVTPWTSGPLELPEGAQPYLRAMQSGAGQLECRIDGDAGVTPVRHQIVCEVGQAPNGL